MFFTFNFKKISVIVLISALALVLLIVAFAIIKPLSLETFASESQQPCLVIDPGHGGIDGGAVSLNGVKESNINLSIGLRLQSMAEFCGVKTLMTRIDDSMRTDREAYSEHDELVYRTELCNNTPAASLISIHQNFYPTSQPSGAQVLYAASEGSKEFGNITHKNIVSHLQPENRRVSGPAAKELYITSHINCPGILVECGFMSNFGDLEKLCREDYQNSLAAVLLGSYLQYKNVYK